MDDKRNEYVQVKDRNFSRLLNPRSTLLVSCCDSSGKSNVLSVAWHSPLSIDPPLVGISISPKRYSHDLIDTTGEFVIHIVGPEMKEIVAFCGSVSGKDVDKITQKKLPTHPARMVRPPVLSDAFGYLECRVEQVVPVGDHTWFIGKVLYSAVRSGYFSDAWDSDLAKVLLYLKLDQFGYFCSLD